MTEKQDKENLEAALKGYKEEILPVNKGSLILQRDLYFMGMTQRGYEVEFDPKYEEGCSPTETLLLSLAGCIAIDLVSMLRKMRCDVATCEIDVEGARNLEPPQYYKSMSMMIHISGDGITPKKIDRAISLSRDKYCSVYHSLRKDMELKIEYEISAGAK